MELLRWFHCCTSHYLDLTSPDVAESLGFALHPNTLPALGPLQVEGGDEGKSDRGQVLLHTTAGHPDERGQGVLCDGVVDAVGQHVSWRTNQVSEPLRIATIRCSAHAPRLSATDLGR